MTGTSSATTHPALQIETASALESIDHLGLEAYWLGNGFDLDELAEEAHLGEALLLSRRAL